MSIYETGLQQLCEFGRCRRDGQTPFRQSWTLSKNRNWNNARQYHPTPSFLGSSTTQPQPFIWQRTYASHGGIVDWRAGMRHRVRVHREWEVSYRDDHEISVEDEVNAIGMKAPRFQSGGEARITLGLVFRVNQRYSFCLLTWNFNTDDQDDLEDHSRSQ
jgi:hypothetical protein